MLVLTRRVDELIKIGDNITVHILGISNSQVKIGFSAPREIEITRDNCKTDKFKKPIIEEESKGNI